MPIKHLVISGGGQTMIQSIGAVQYLEQNGFIDLKNIKSMYGTSAGALVSVFVLLKFDWETLNEYIIKRPWHKVFPIKANTILDSYSKKGLFDNSVIIKCFKPLFDAKDISMEITMKQFFEYSGIELHMFSFELNSFEGIDISYKTYPDLPLIKALHMTSSFPVFLSPVLIENKCYIDGGIICNYPLNKCIEANGNVDEILGFNNDYSSKTESDNKEQNNNITNDSSLIDFLLGLFIKIIRSMETDTKQQKIKNEIICKAEHISVDVMKKCLYSHEVRQQLLDSGVNASKEFLQKIEEELKEKEEKEKEEKEEKDENNG
jgi:predicted acylesterase/phospholipase RssA